MVLAAVGSAAVGTAIEVVKNELTEGRSVVLEVDNNTDLTLVHTGDHHDHGGYAETPKTIPPRQAMIFGAESTGFMTGTEGNATFNGDGLNLVVSWDNPYIGGNESDASISGNVGRYFVTSTTGSGNTGAHMRYELTQLPFLVYGAIRDKWFALGAMAGQMGMPVTDELGTPDGRGRFNHFQGGSIYWTADTGAFEVHGLIRDKWAATGWETGMGYPITDETPTPDGRGRFNHFRAFPPTGPVDASIYWTPETGAHLVYGAIRAKWAETGWETGIGYPTSDEMPDADNVGRVQTFERGTIAWNPATGAVIR